MKFKFIGKEPLDFGGLGIVEPGQIFEVEEGNDELFKGTVLFEKVKEVKKEVIKEEE